jgi:hypothetical protein
MSLIDKLNNPGANVYYEQGFRNVFEDHLEYIKKNKQTNITTVTVDENTGARFAGDFRGLMLAVNVFPHLHWFNMRLNGYSSCSDYDGSQLTLELINENLIKELTRTYKIKRKN